MIMKTGIEYRFKGKLRMQRFREALSKKGYKSITIFIPEEMKVELNRLKEKNKMNRQAAIEHIFNTYQESINNKNVNRDDNCIVCQNMKNLVDTNNLSIESKTTPKIGVLIAPENYPNSQPELPIIETIDSTVNSSIPTLSKPSDYDLMDSDDKKLYLIKTMNALKKNKVSWKDIVNALNKAEIEPIRNKEWNSNSIAAFFFKNKSLLESKYE